MIDLNKLEKLASCATPGPWEEDGYILVSNPSGLDNDVVTRFSPDMKEVDIDFIETANPAVVLEIIGLIRKQEAALNGAVERQAHEAMTADRDAYRERAEKAEQALEGMQGALAMCQVKYEEADTERRAGRPVPSAAQAQASAPISFGYVATRSHPESGTVFNTSRIMEERDALACAAQWRKENRTYKIDVLPVFIDPSQPQGAKSLVSGAIQAMADAGFDVRVSGARILPRSAAQSDDRDLLPLSDERIIAIAREKTGSPDGAPFAVPYTKICRVFRAILATRQPAPTEEQLQNMRQSCFDAGKAYGELDTAPVIATVALPDPEFREEQSMRATAYTASQMVLFYQQGRAAGIEEAAKWLEKSADDYHQEQGHQESDTGAWVYPGNGQDYINTLAELAEEIRALNK